MDGNVGLADLRVEVETHDGRLQCREVELVVEVSELSLALLGWGDCVIELTATAGAVTETRLFAVRVR
jgi:hypothetical protein